MIREAIIVTPPSVAGAKPNIAPMGFQIAISKQTGTLSMGEKEIGNQTHTAWAQNWQLIDDHQPPSAMPEALSEKTILIQPFHPSTTLEQLRKHRCATLNHCDDVRVYAGAVCGRRDFPTEDATIVRCPRLSFAFAHLELEVLHIEEDVLRPKIFLRIVASYTHFVFPGFHRAQAAVIEAAILVSRLDRLPRARVAQEIAQLQHMIDRSAGLREREAWDWLQEKIAAHSIATDSTPAKNSGA